MIRSTPRAKIHGVSGLYKNVITNKIGSCMIGIFWNIRHSKLFTGNYYQYQEYFDIISNDRRSQNILVSFKSRFPVDDVVD